MRFRCAPAYGFGKAKKLELDKSDQLLTPGPGKYKPKKYLYQQPIWTIGNSQRPKEQNADIPGPGAYNLRYKLQFPDVPSYSMASKPKQNLDQMNTPGPGSYSPKSILSQKNIFSFGEKYKSNSNEITPGPGNYNIRKEKDLLVPSSIFGHALKFDSDISKTPGPGIYNSDITKVKRQQPIYSFSKEKRILENKDENPGPGAYNQKKFFGEEGKKISMGSKFISKSMELVPGPGQYETDNYNNILVKLPNIKIGTEKRFSDILSENPGPGAYNYSDNAKYIQLNNPSWKIGTSLRQPLNDITDSPGPGKYNVSRNIGENSPKYSMGIKDNELGKKFITPGPGKYNSDQQNIYKRYPSWKIGTSNRDEELNKHIREGFPGPGTYQNYDNHLLSSPKYGFGTQKKYNDRYNDNPGPGSYHIPCSIVDVNDYTREQGVFDNNFKYI